MSKSLSKIVAPAAVGGIFALAAMSASSDPLPPDLTYRPLPTQPLSEVKANDEAMKPTVIPQVRQLLERRYAFDLPSEPEEIAGLSAERVANGFAQFLRFVRDNAAERTEMKKDAHWMPQSYILKRYLQQFLPDFIGRVETFGRDFAYVLQHYTGPHVPDAAAKFNEGPTPPHRFEAVADAEARTLLVDIYGADYELFGYATHDQERSDTP